jgi:alanyl-tRNA synthetase
MTKGRAEARGLTISKLTMDSHQIRKEFLTFFKQKGHQIVDSAPIVLKDDPTLMFTNAGMNQFKDFFLGNKKPSSSRIADTQKCLRVSGKHNDLEEVGFDTYHHTMFEMLGNWSFGDYFKEDAINWAWELLTVVYKLPKDRLYATIFEGDAKEGLDRDQEAFDYWEKHLPADRILNGSKKDNFWEMGDVGPCGPCTEVHIDLRDDNDRAKIPGDQLVNQDNPLVVEIWNLVFIQFNRKADGSLESLPEKHVDTGMGFERLAMAIQGKKSNYDTDVFQPLIQHVAKAAGVEYGESEKTDIATRVVADHIRAISFTIADGQLPSNNKAGYVIRRILRRAVRYGYTYLGFREPFLCNLVPVLAVQFKEVFPELHRQLDFVSKVIREEEQSFLRTLENGLKRMESLKGGKSVEGKVAFEMYDTYGFPLDLTMLIAREYGMTVDEVGFAKEMAAQKERSKADAKKSTGDWVNVNGEGNTEFLGYESLTAKSKILRYREIDQKGKKLFQLVLDKTPFYAESGGQVGDTGVLKSNGEEVRVLDTKKENDLIVHFTSKLPQNLNGGFDAFVDAPKRISTENNHSATHLLHAALRQVLGTHVQQKGSLVNEHLLRFDFSHFSKMTSEEIRNVEQLVNEKIRENIPRQVEVLPFAEATKKGAMALFGEKYGDKVRVVTFDPSFSVELCGGTHVPASGRLGFFKIISESSVAAGVRRIEAYTARGSEDFINHQLDQLNQIRELLKNPADELKAISDLLSERSALQKELEQLRRKESANLKEDLKKQVELFGEAKCIFYQGPFADADQVKQLSYQLRQEIEGLVLVVGAEIQGKPLLSVMLDERFIDKGLNASELVREMAKEIQGGGGGQPFYATAGGKNLGGVASALLKGRSVLNEKLT